MVIFHSYVSLPEGIGFGVAPLPLPSEVSNLRVAWAKMSNSQLTSDCNSLLSRLWSMTQYDKHFND